MTELSEKVNKAIAALQDFEPDDGYYLCYSGGKDSDVIRILAALSGVKHDIVHSLTTADAPETVRYVKSIPNVIIHRPAKTMWQLIVDKGMPPTRIVRYCCEVLKEHGGKGRVKVTGVRAAESARRAANAGLVTIVGKSKTVQTVAEDYGADWLVSESGGLVLNTDNDASRAVIEYCYRTTSTMVNPIVDWSDNDVWDFLRHYGCQSNPLYQCGYKRVGCIGCPMSGTKGMQREFDRYPKYRNLYVKAFDRMIEHRRQRGIHSDDNLWQTGEDVMRWWLGYDLRQLTLDDIADAAGVEEVNKWF